MPRVHGSSWNRLPSSGVRHPRGRPCPDRCPVRGAPRSRDRSSRSVHTPGLLPWIRSGPASVRSLYTLPSVLRGNPFPRSLVPSCRHSKPPGSPPDVPLNLPKPPQNPSQQASITVRAFINPTTRPPTSTTTRVVSVIPVDPLVWARAHDVSPCLGRRTQREPEKHNPSNRAVPKPRIHPPVRTWGTACPTAQDRWPLRGRSSREYSSGANSRTSSRRHQDTQSAKVCKDQTKILFRVRTKPV